MNIDNLEMELRNENCFSEDDIRQILSLLFAINANFRIPITTKMPSYYPPYLVWVAKEIYKKFSIGKIVSMQMFEANINIILKIILPKDPDEKIYKDTFLERVKEEMIKILYQAQQNIVDISTKALEATFTKISFRNCKIDELMGIFNQEVVSQLKRSN